MGAYEDVIRDMVEDLLGTSKPLTLPEIAEAVTPLLLSTHLLECRSGDRARYRRPVKSPRWGRFWTSAVSL